MEQQVVGYNGTFATMLREVLDKHPVTGEKTTLKELAAAIGIRQQTVSLYKNGETQPTPETLVKMAEFFGVSIDYLLTGVSSQHKSIHEVLGLSEDAIGFLKRVKVTEDIDGMTPVLATLNGLLEDRDFYEFLEDLTTKAANVKAMLNGEYDKSQFAGLYVEGYFIWDLQKFVEAFVVNQLNKRGLSIEENSIKINR